MCCPNREDWSKSLDLGELKMRRPKDEPVAPADDEWDVGRLKSGRELDEGLTQRIENPHE